MKLDGILKELHALRVLALRIENKIDLLNKQSDIHNKEYLTTQEACYFLGCTRGMVWKLVNAGKLTKLKLDNGRVYYSSVELNRLITGK